MVYTKRMAITLERDDFEKACVEVMQRVCDQRGLGKYEELDLELHPQILADTLILELVNRRLFGPR